MFVPKNKRPWSKMLIQELISVDIIPIKKFQPHLECYVSHHKAITLNMNTNKQKKWQIEVREDKKEMREWNERAREMSLVVQDRNGCLAVFSFEKEKSLVHFDAYPDRPN